MSNELHAAIDIGTNTVLLLVAAKHEQHLDPIHEEQRIPRLGKGVDASGNLSEASIARVMESLKEYQKILSADYPNIQSLSVTATSAVRDAGNRKYFLDKIKQETGFEVEVLNGRQEAKLTYLGALSMLPDTGNAAVMDIGGGSTEIAYGKNGILLDSHSYNMGSVRFTERFIKSDPPSDEQHTSCRDEIRDLLQARPFEIEWNRDKVSLVGVAGTVTSLAYIDMGLTKYDTDKINGYSLSRNTIKEWAAKISKTKTQTLVETYPEVMRGRAEVILAGVLILEEVMNFYKIPKVKVSTGGVRHGAILQAQ